MKSTLLFVCFSTSVLAADVTGTWHLTLVRFGEQFADARVDLKAEGTKITGTLNELKLEGTAGEDSVTITATRPNGQTFGVLEGRLSGEEINGTVKQGDEEFGWKA